MKKLLSLIILTLTLAAFGPAAPAGAAEVTITGAGASVPVPLYERWARFYESEEGKKVEYLPVGSNEGIRMVISQEVDFGASDVPMAQEALQKANLAQFPTAVTGIVPVVNIEGVGPGQLRLSGELLAEILLGEITRWNDPDIRKLNPDLDLPPSEITAIFRADGSGSTWLLTNYLTRVSPDWAEDIGFSATPAWSADTLSEFAEGSEGMVEAVRGIPGSIGYVGYTYAKRGELAHVTMINSSGRFVEPGLDTFRAAAAGARWQLTPNMGVILTDQAGINAWPITGATFVFVHRRPRDCEAVREVLRFFRDWAYEYGDELAETVGFLPVPEGSTYFMNRVVIRHIRCDGKPLFSK